MAEEKSPGDDTGNSENGAVIGASVGPRRIFAKSPKRNQDAGGDLGSEAGGGDGPVDARTTDPVEISAKRKRGRPPKSGTGAAAAAAAKRPARSPVSDEKDLKAPEAKPKKPAPVKGPVDGSSVEKVAQALAGIHLVMALQLQAPEMELSETEARKLAEAGSNVAAWYKIDLAGTSRTFDWLVLGYTVTIIYAPRFKAISARRVQPGA